MEVRIAELGPRPHSSGRSWPMSRPGGPVRRVPGHWVGDLVVGGDMSSCLITPTYRCSHVVRPSRLDAHDSGTVEGRLEEMAVDIPGTLRRTIAWDQGAEMAEVAAFELATDFKIYFCDAARPRRGRPTRTPTSSSGSTSRRARTSRG